MGTRFGKGKGNDATQDVSLSQFVPPKAPSFSKPPTISRGGQNNDMSLWAGVVVGTSDFAPAPTKKVRSNAWKWIALALVLGALAVAAVFVFANGPGAPAPAIRPVAAPIDKAVDAPAIQKEVPAASGGSGSAVVDAPAAAGSGAAPTVASVTGDVDAVSGVAPIIKPKPVAKKRVVRKTTAKAGSKKIAPKKKKIVPKKR